MAGHVTQPADAGTRWATVSLMRILIMGGTAFVGRHIAQAAIDGGHQVTLFHRGQTGAGLFPEATHLTGDRNQSLAALGQGEWDATVDVSAYLPRQVRSLAAELDGRGGQYLFISSASVYRTPVARGFSEDAPLNELADPDTEEITLETYGGLKVACERVSATSSRRSLPLMASWRGVSLAVSRRARAGHMSTAWRASRSSHGGTGMSSGTG